MNNTIQGLIKKAFGYRNKERFRTDIFLHFGELDLYPSQSKTPRRSRKRLKT
jgi:hypothetical protein